MMRRVFTGGRARVASPSLSSPGPLPLDPAARLEGGVDEAGYGPLLGPLCVGAAALERPGGGTEVWDLLRGAVGRGGDVEDLPVVADSKDVYSGPGGFARIERTALAFHGLARGGRIPDTVEAFVAASPGNSRASFEAHPWYADLDVPLPRVVPRAAIEEDLERIEAACARSGVRIRAADVRIVPEVEFNEGVRSAGNKAEVVFGLAAAAVARLAVLPRRGGARILVDRLGGRRFYAEGLARHLPQFLPVPLREGRRRSTYRLHGEAAGARLEFAVGGESLAFSCALASILAKYAREVLVERLNAHFLARAPGLRPTAGYVADGRRFVAELRGVLGEALRVDLLLRIR